MDYGFFIDITGAKFDETQWIQAFPLGTWTHPQHGKIDITPEKIRELADNVKRGVRGQDLDIDYDHKARETIAAGWVKDAEARADGLWLNIQWTDRARQHIAAGEYRYFSPEFTDAWTNPATGVTHKNVLFGGALTNRPFLKGILPINMSELPQEGQVDLKELAKLLGLAEDATEEQVMAAAKDAKTKADEKAKAEADEKERKEKEEQSKVPAAVAASENDAIKALAELVQQSQQASQTQIAALTETVQTLVKTTREQGARIKLDEITAGGKYLLPPVVTDEMTVLLSEASPTQAARLEKVIKALAETGLPEGGERGAGRGPRAFGEPDPQDAFEKAITKLMEGDPKMSYGDAAEIVSAQNPQLSETARSASYIRARDEEF
jgi:phage I-like protein